MQLGDEQDELSGAALFNTSSTDEVLISTVESDTDGRASSIFNRDVEEEPQEPSEAEKVASGLSGDQNSQSGQEQKQDAGQSNEQDPQGGEGEEGVFAEIDLGEELDWAAEAAKYKELSGHPIKTKEDFIYYADKAFALHQALSENESIMEIDGSLGLTDEELLIQTISSEAKPWEKAATAEKIAALYEPIDKDDETKGIKLTRDSVVYAEKLRKDLANKRIGLVGDITSKVDSDFSGVITYKENLKNALNSYEFMGVKLSPKTAQDVYRYIVEGQYSTKTGALTRDGDGYKNDAETAIWANKSTREALIAQIVSKEVQSALSKQIKEVLV